MTLPYPKTDQAPIPGDADPTQWIQASDWNAYGTAIDANTATGASNTSALATKAGLSAGKLVASEFPALTGDVTTAGGALATTLATSGVSAGTYGAPRLTVNAKGLVTAAVPGVVYPTGAVGDGTTDDTTALQNAINSAIALNVPLIIPAPSVGYLITATLTITAATNLTILGYKSKIIFNSLASGGFPCLTIDAASHDVEINGIFFQGSTSSDEKFVNTMFAITVFDGATDVLVTKCRIANCNPGGCNDSRNSLRIHFIDNYCHNCVGSWSSGNFSTIENCDFICDTLIPSSSTGRAHAVYIYGQLQNVTVRNCRLKTSAKSLFRFARVPRRLTTKTTISSKAVTSKTTGKARFGQAVTQAR